MFDAGATTPDVSAEMPQVASAPDAPEGPPVTAVQPTHDFAPAEVPPNAAPVEPPTPAEAPAGNAPAQPAVPRAPRLFVAKRTPKPGTYSANTPLLVSMLVHVLIAAALCIFMPELVREIVRRDAPVRFVEVKETPKPEPPKVELPPLPEAVEPDTAVQPSDAPDVVVETEPVQDLDHPVAQAETVAETNTSVHADWKRPPGLTPAPAPKAPAPKPVVGSGAAPAYVPPAPPAVRRGPPVEAPPAPPRGPSRSARPKVSIQPSYPESERKAGNEGCVVLEVLVEANGKPSNVKVLSPSAPASFIDAAVRAARLARYEPALEQGVPVAGLILLKVDFRLR
ncbi:MAG: TonB family protein [Planctomycetota bacterium]|nr:TonB family protein [Planctomycetota bacterium]